MQILESPYNGIILIGENMIRSKAEKEDFGLEIDLDGPEGNAFVLLGHASQLAKQLELDPKTITDDMKSGDYEHLLSVFEKHFPMVTLWRTIEE